MYRVPLSFASCSCVVYLVLTLCPNQFCSEGELKEANSAIRTDKWLGFLFFRYISRKSVTLCLLPNSFSDMFKLSNQIHSYNTRNSNKFFIFHSRTNIRQFSIRFRGPKFFNSLPLDIVNCKRIGFFNKKTLKNSSLLSLYIDFY